MLGQGAIEIVLLLLFLDAR